MKILKKIFQVIVKIINHCVPVDSRDHCILFLILIVEQINMIL